MTICRQVLRAAVVAAVIAFAAVAHGGSVYTELDFPGSIVIPDLSTASPPELLPAPLDFVLATNDVDTSIDYSFSYDDGTGTKDFEGTMILISSSGHVPGVAPSIATWVDLTDGSGVDGGHVTLSMFTQDSTPAYDPDLLFDGRDAALVTFLTDIGDDPQYATIAVPEPGIVQLGGLAGIALLLFCRRRRIRSRTGAVAV